MLRRLLAIAATATCLLAFSATASAAGAAMGPGGLPFYSCSKMCYF